MDRKSNPVRHGRRERVCAALLPVTGCLCRRCRPERIQVSRGTAKQCWSSPCLTAFSRALEAFPELPLDQKGITFDHQHLFFFISTVRFEHNLLIRSQAPCPLGHADYLNDGGSVCARSYTVRLQKRIKTSSSCRNSRSRPVARRFRRRGTS